MKRALLFVIRIYQKTLSPDTGYTRFLYPYGYCRFHPTCSEYTYRAIEKYGILKGAWLGSKRIARCHPWSEPRIDRVP